MLRFNFSSISKILLSILVSVLIAAGLFYVGQKYFLASKVKRSSIVKALPDFLSQLKESWLQGQDKRLKETTFKKCEFFKNNSYPEEFFECNSVYFDCFLNGQEKAKFSDYEFRDHHFIPQKRNLDSYVEDFGNEIRILFLDKLTKKTFKVSLQKSCGQKKLPVSIYSAGPKSENAYIWDNYDFDVFIDKNYISRFDIWSWARSINDIKMELQYSDEAKFFEPAVDLKRKKQIAYCHSRGKQILESRYFDAATFYPSSRQRNYKYPFHWTKREQTFLTSEKRVNKSDCNDAMVAECKEFYPEANLNPFGVSWIGVYHSLGSKAESFRNIFEPSANLKLSSSSLIRSSGWHRLGLRGSWDGLGFKTRNFKFLEQYSGRLIDHEPNLEGVAFRCMELR